MPWSGRSHTVEYFAILDAVKEDSEINTLVYETQMQPFSSCQSPLGPRLQKRAGSMDPSLLDDGTRFARNFDDMNVILHENDPVECRICTNFCQQVSSRSAPKMDQGQRVSQRSSVRGPPASQSTESKTSKEDPNKAGNPGGSSTDTISDYAIIALVAIQNACISIKNALYNVYLVLKFIFTKPDVAWDLVSTTFHLIKVARDAGLWSWSQLWDIFYAQTIAPMIQSQKAAEEAEQQKANS
ncbi:hypothetical protein RB195_007328 [Necator americanus]|uniref:Uncharacterized protein n=1 Tax=Necator americanus TaxID=51031 RepID=A0ABR1BWP4_NECAM